jgi:hypothetical protein
MQFKKDEDTQLKADEDLTHKPNAFAATSTAAGYLQTI